MGRVLVHSKHPLRPTDAHHGPARSRSHLTRLRLGPSSSFWLVGGSLHQRRTELSLPVLDAVLFLCLPWGIYAAITRAAPELSVVTYVWRLARDSGTRPATSTGNFPAHLLTCLPAYLLTCLPAYMFTCLLYRGGASLARTRAFRALVRALLGPAFVNCH